MKLGKRWVGWGAVALAGAALVWWLQPRPIAVDTAVIDRGEVAEVVVEQGEARAHDRFVVAAPVAGRLTRIELHEGDAVRAGEALAWMAPVPLTATEAEQARARLLAAEAQSRAAAADVARADATLAQARRETERAERLLAQRFVSGQALEQARLAEDAALAGQRAARERQQAAAAEVSNARAALQVTRDATRPLPVTAPASGRVLKLVEQSERVLAQGSPVVVIGDPERIEIVAEVLSTDAVRMKPGMRAAVAGWGGAELPGRVRTVRPAAYTKVSALGVEEQRVDVVIDLEHAAPGLGDAYRIEARIEIAQRENATRVPTAALFRTGEVWRVFVVDKGRLQARDVKIGLRGQDRAEVLDGLGEGDLVVLYPAASLEPGTRVRTGREGR